MKMIGLLFVWLIGFTRGEISCGHGLHPPCTTIPPAEVDHAIVDLSLHYNVDMCLELLLVDCAKHVTQGDEVVCASNNVTYENHCRFVHARCEYQLSGHQPELTKVHSGPCFTTTITHSTAPHSTTIAPAVTTLASETTGVAVTTNIFQQMFCLNVGTISCGHEFALVCGSDGVFYMNSCYFAVAKCKNPSLTTVNDLNTCHIPRK